MKLLKKIWRRKPGEKNKIANSIAKPLPLSEIKKRIPVPCSDLTISQTEFLNWQKTYFPEGAKIFNTTMHKKMLELFISYKLLDIQKADVYMDAAGGQYSYASRIICKQSIIQDIRLSERLKSFHGNKVTYMDASCAKIPLPDRSVDKISCHHSIEHFQQNADMDFISEVKRILAPGGKCVIIPVFIADTPLLLTDSTSFTSWNETGQWVSDESASLPGGAGSGHFARVYSPETLHDRILSTLLKPEFNAQLISVRMESEEIPNENYFMEENQAIMNYYYKALLIERNK
jgi:SAM-dependent methyltransferase